MINVYSLSRGPGKNVILLVLSRLGCILWGPIQG
jgi:hypothetical protein